MASGTPGVDELVREYLLFRGFTNTLRAFESEIKNDKDKNFRADRIVEQLQAYVHSFDIAAVKNLWQYLDRRFFSRLEHIYTPSVRRLETCLMRYYLVHCVTAGRADRISDFFDRYATELQPHPEWRDWFALPYVRNPDQDKTFSMYFHRSWSESVLLSVYNLLSVIFDSMPLPALLQYCDDQRRIHKLSEEVEGLRHELHILHVQQHLQHTADLENQQQQQQQQQQQAASSKRATFSRKQGSSAAQSHDSKTGAALPTASSVVAESRDEDGSPTASALPVRHSSPGSVAITSEKAVSSPVTMPQDAKAMSVVTANSGVSAGTAPTEPSPLQIKDNFFKSSDKSPPISETSEPASSTTATLSSTDSSPSRAHHAAAPVSSRSEVSSSAVLSNPTSVVKALSSFVLPVNSDTPSSDSPATSLRKAAVMRTESSQSAGGGSAVITGRDATNTHPTPEHVSSTPGVFIPGITNVDKRSTTLPKSFRAVAGPSIAAPHLHTHTHTQTDGGAAAAVTSDRSLEKTPSDDSSSSLRAVAEEDSPFIFLSEETYSEHRASVAACRFAPGGACIASCDVEGVVKVWTSSPCRTLSTVMAKTPVMTIDWMAAAGNSSSVLLLGYGNGKVRLYDVNSKSTTAEFEASSEHPRVVSLASTYNTAGSLIAVGSAGAATQASLALEQQAASLSTGAPPTHHATSRNHHRLSLTRFFSSNSSSSSSMSVDTGSGQLALWDACSTRQIMALTLDPAPTCINTLQFNRQGNLLACGSADGMIRIFDVSNGDCMVGWHAHMGQVYSIAFSHDESTLYSLGHDGKVNQWSIRQVAQKVNELPLDTSAIGGLHMAVAAGPLTYSPYNSLLKVDDDGDHILTSSGSQGIIYQLSDGSPNTKPSARRVVALRGHPSPVVAIDWSTALSCGTCLTTAHDGSIYVSTLLKQ